MGQIGYVLAQAMESAGCSAVPILTQVVVDQYSEAFKDPTKFVGPIYGSIEAQALAQSLGYVNVVVTFSKKEIFANFRQGANNRFCLYHLFVLFYVSSNGLFNI